LTAAADAVKAAMTRLAQLREQIADGRLSPADIDTVYAEATDLYLAARRRLERTEAELRLREKI
jgi:hypothetical protein